MSLFQNTKSPKRCRQCGKKRFSFHCLKAVSFPSHCFTCQCSSCRRFGGFKFKYALSTEVPTETMTFMFIHARSELFVTVQYVLSQLRNNNIPTITSTVCCGCVQLIDVIAFSSVHSQLPSFQRERRAGRAHFCNYQNASVERISSRSRLSRIFSFHPCQIMCEVWFGFLWLCFFWQFSCNLGHIIVLVRTASVKSLCGGLKPPTVTLPPKN